MITLPDRKTKTWVQTNSSDVLGDIWASYNIDVNSNAGRMRLGKRILLNTATADQANLGLPIAFKAFASANYSICDTRVFVSGTNPPSSNFSPVTGTPTDCSKNVSDLELFNGYLWATRNSSTNVSYFDGASTWATLAVGGSTGVLRMLCNYANRMYMTDGSSKIVSWDTSNTVATLGNQYTLDFSARATYEIIAWMRASANRIWIGTVSTTGGKGYVYSWDGSSTQVTSSYRLEASGALACVIKDDVPYVMDSNGNLLMWSGGNFKKLTGFNRFNNQLFTGALNSNTQRFIHPNGMAIINGRIKMLVNTLNADNTGTMEETCPSGVWEFDETRGLVHLGSPGLTKSGGTISDFGQARVSRVGAIAEINIPDTASTRNGTFVCGMTYYTDATTTTDGIFYDDSNDTLQKGGSFVTTKIQSPNVTEVWQSVYIRNKSLSSASDKIVLKWRIHETDPVEATITWTSTTTFTVLNSAVVVSNYWTSGTGGEVDVTQGVGAGRCSHITNAVNNAGTWTVTVDETYTGASTQTSKARFNSWNKVGIVTSTSSYFSNFQIPMVNGTSTRIQFKVWMLITGRKELEELVIQHKSSQDAK